MICETCGRNYGGIHKGKTCIEYLVWEIEFSDSSLNSLQEHMKANGVVDGRDWDLDAVPSRAMEVVLEFGAILDAALAVVKDPYDMGDTNIVWTEDFNVLQELVSKYRHARRKDE